MSFYVSTAIYFLLHCDEWDHFVAPPRHKFVTGATSTKTVTIWHCQLGWVMGGKKLFPYMTLFLSELDRRENLSNV